MKGVISSSFYQLLKYTRDHCCSGAVYVVLLYMTGPKYPFSFQKSFWEDILAAPNSFKRLGTICDD